MKTTKGGKFMNPTDAYRKELRKKELKRNKEERKKVREVGILKKDPEVIKDQIEKLELMNSSLGMSLPPPPLPPPPPGPPPKDQVLSHTPLPPPPPLQQSAQPPPPGTNESGRETNISALLDESSSNDTVQG